jgi:hypothetical protein
MLALPLVDMIASQIHHRAAGKVGKRAIRPHRRMKRSASSATRDKTAGSVKRGLTAKAL